MNVDKAISKSEMVLLAAYERWPDMEFTSEELVIACWQKYPDSFGLQGYSDRYPDSNIVYRHIMGKNSIVKKQRWLSQRGQKRYMVTPAGVGHALKLRGAAEGRPELEQHRIDRLYEQVLLRAFAGTAWAKFKNGQIEELTFTDACGFWSINPRSSGEQYMYARRDLAAAIEVARRHIKATGNSNGKVTLAAKVSVSSQDLDELEALEAALQARFKDQLDLISRRSVRWGKVTNR
jgi:hypothetical protein